MVWGIIMTFITLFGMMVLAAREAMTAEWTSRNYSESTTPKNSANAKPTLPKAA